MKKLTVLLSALLLVGSVFAQKAPTTKLISSSEESIVVNVQLGGFSTSKVQTPQGDQNIISSPGMVSMLEAGAPDLPMFAIPAIIGDQAEMSVSVIDAQYTDYSNMNIAPSKGNFSRQINPDEVAYTYGAMYQQDAFWPATQAYLEAPYILRDFRGQNIMVRPFAYNPVTRTLRVYTNMTIAMNKVSDNGVNQKAARKSNTIMVSPEFKTSYSHRFVNFGQTTSKYTFVEDGGSMLVIAADQYAEAVQPLVDWKNISGRPCSLVTISEIGSNSDTQIKNYISNLYDNGNGDITYILLVGDLSDVASHSMSGGRSDNWYAMLDGTDYYCEAFVGRFSCNSVADVENQVAKVLYYERDMPAGLTWVNRGMGVGANEGSGSGHMGGEADYVHINYIRDTLLHYTYETVTQQYSGVGAGTNANAISADLNEGVSIVNYCNHGSQTSWAVANYSNSHVNALTNDYKWPYVISVACNNGQFDGTCFGEAWLRATNNATGAPTGAIGGMFSWISQPWTPPMTGQDEMIDILTEWIGAGSFRHTIGAMAENGNMKILDAHPSDAGETHNTWINFADPSVMMRTDNPTDMNVTANPSVLMLGMNELSVSADADFAIATLSMNGEVLASGLVENGQCNLSFEALSNVGTAQLVVLGYNRVTSMTDIDVVPAEGAYITVNNYALNAEQANYGETLDMSIDFKNVGVEIASNLTVALSTECQYVEILSDQASIAEVDPDETVTVEGFQFKVTEDAPDGTPAQFSVSISDGTDVWEGKLTILLHAPVLTFDNIENNGEKLFCQFSNSGSAPFYGGSFSIYSSSVDLVFTEPEITFDDTVYAGDSLTFEMPYTINENVEPGTTIQVAYELASGLQLVLGEYVLAYGAIMDDFEAGSFGENWTLSSNYPWTIASEGRDGYCAKSANAGQSNSEGFCMLTVDILAAGNLTFWYKVSSETNWDKLHFYKDNQEIEVWSGDINWTEYTLPVTVGTHTFKWSYIKDSSVNSGQDCAWIDDIKFPPVEVINFIDPVTDLEASITGMNVNLAWTGTTNAEAYVISRNGETIATVTETNYTESVNEGVYKYSVFAQIGDQISKPESVMVQVLYDGAEEAQEANFRVYPNPTHGVLNISAGGSDFEYTLFNGMGQKVANGSANGTQQISVNGMAKGVYFLHLNSGSQVLIQKVVVE